MGAPKPVWRECSVEDFNPESGEIFLRPGGGIIFAEMTPESRQARHEYFSERQEIAHMRASLPVDIVKKYGTRG